MDSLFATILDDGHNVVGAAKCSLFFVDEEKGELWTKVATDNQGEIKVRASSNCCLWYHTLFNLVEFRFSPTLTLTAVAWSSLVSPMEACDIATISFPTAHTQKCPVGWTCS